MDKSTINLDKKTVFNVISDMHQKLNEYGITDNRIALFGSFAKGNPHENSDIDIIIVSSLFEGKNIFERIDMTAKAQIDVQRKFVVPMDILLKTPEEYKYSKSAYFDSVFVI